MSEARTAPPGHLELAGGPADSASAGAPSWTNAYVAARRREGRLYPDAIVARLPDAPASDPHAGEWRLRADSAARLVRRLAGRPRPVTVIDIGSGNGWLASRIAAIPGSDVVGIEANDLELAQARRVFGDVPNLRFVGGDATVMPAPVERVSAIVLASMVQYVVDLPALIRRLRSWLAPGGELHILDSPFYAGAEIAAARERTRRYYVDLGVPEMADVYRHQDWACLAAFAPTVLHDPRSPLARVGRALGRGPRSPFPWIVISEAGTTRDPG